jgi:RNA polymerase sigma-70 factor (ECF subfamily)
LLTAHFDFVWRSLRRLGLSPNEADAGAREVFVLASRKLSVLPQNEKRVLFASVLRVASAYRKRASKRRRGSAPERAGEAGGARGNLDEILSAMELEQCSVFMLYELEELSAPEIAALLDVSVETVCSRLHTAREGFDSALRRQRLHASSEVKA